MGGKYTRSNGRMRAKESRFHWKTATFTSATKLFAFPADQIPLSIRLFPLPTRQIAFHARQFALSIHEFPFPVHQIALATEQVPFPVPQFPSSARLWLTEVCARATEISL
jgi:hypothetical protein